jgi:lysophospholipase L1-like esterase
MTDPTSRARLGLVLVALFVLLAMPALAQPVPKDERRAPLRLVSLGDSITEAVNAEEFHPWKPLTRNPWAGWANGYVGKWELRLGRTDVNSHNQRITEQFGKVGRKNKEAAKTGAESDVLWKQARKAVKKKADYVTILMGQNDVCGDDVSEIPTDEEFELNVRTAFDLLRDGLPPGATVYALAIVDIHQLWVIKDDLELFFDVDCADVWDLLASEDVPCGTMLGGDDVAREFTRGRLDDFNALLAGLVAEYDASDPHHHWEFTYASFDLKFEAEDVSEVDCFHPSAEGQRKLSEATWTAGPFAAP